MYLRVALQLGNAQRATETSQRSDEVSKPLIRRCSESGCVMSVEPQQKAAGMINQQLRGGASQRRASL